MLGAWDVKVTVGAMPEKVATAFAEATAALVVAEYTPIAYLGSQVVNGTNHAVLAEQLLVTGKDTKNVVLMIFNEKEMGCTLVNIERVVEGGEEFGGAKVDVNTELSAEAKVLFDAALADFVGSTVEPFALLATQVVRGMDYIFAAEVTPVTENPVKKVAKVTINSEDKTVSFVDILN